MRISYICPSFYPAHVYGGPVVFSYKLVKGLALRGHHVRVLTTDAAGSDETLALPKNIEMSMARGLSVRYCRRLASDSVSGSLVKNLPEYAWWADVVHLVGVYSFPTIPTLITCKAMNKSVVWSPHGSFQNFKGCRRLAWKAAWNWICRLVAPRRTVIHVMSKAEEQGCKIRMPAIRAHIIPYGVTAPESAKYRRETPVLKLLYLGRIHPIKGLERLLEACKLLQTTSQLRWSLVIAGGGESQYVAFIRRQIEYLGLQGLARMVGEVLDSEKQRILDEADVLVLPSIMESFGNVVIEALSAGMPVIASKGTPWQELEQTGCGLWVENEPASLCAAISAISQMPLHEMGKKGHAWVVKHYNFEQTLTRLEELYAELL